jgi:hypothetical protein
MKNSTVDGLLALTPEEIKIVYWHCIRGTVKQMLNDVPMAESTIYKALKEQIQPTLHIERWIDIRDEVCRPLRAMVDNPQDLDNWPEGYREKLEALRDSIESLEPPPGSKMPSSNQDSQSTPRRGIPWPFVALPLFLVCLLCIAGVAFAGSRLFNIFGRENNTTPQATQSAKLFVEATATVEPSPTKKPTDTETLLPTDTLIPTLTPTPTASLTPTETLSPSPSPTPTLPALFFDEFTNGKSDNWQTVYGTPIITNNSLTFSDHTLMTLGDLGSDIEVSFDVSNMQCQQHVGSRGITIGLRYQNPNNMVALRIFDQDDCAVTWFLVKDGKWNKIPNSTSQLPPKDNNGVRHLVITVQGNTYNAPFGVPVVLEEFLSGGVALIASPSVIIDNFKVSSFSP